MIYVKFIIKKNYGWQSQNNIADKAIDLKSAYVPEGETLVSGMKISEKI